MEVEAVQMRESGTEVQGTWTSTTIGGAVQLQVQVLRTQSSQNSDNLFSFTHGNNRISVSIVSSIQCGYPC